MPQTKTRLPAAAEPAPPESDTASSDPPVADVPEEPGRIGTVIDDRYRIVGTLGEGGMGIVYRAEHVYIRRPVALKILSADMAEHPQLFERFEREALAIGRLDHPNCVSVLDFGHLPDGSCYLTMPVLEGRTLADVLRRGRIPTRRALRIARHIAGALAHIHNAGIVHRDVKPENIVLVDREGDPDFATLLDFGIAKLLRSDDDTDTEDLTVAGQRFGTPAYMSPEQAIGATLDARSDVYSLSIVLYEMLCGVPPFEHRDPVRLMEMQEKDSVPRMARMARDLVVADDVEQMVLRGLAKQASDRYDKAVELIAAIDACLEAPSTEEEPRQPVYKRPRVWAAVGVGVALIVTALLLWPSNKVRESDTAARARELITQGKPGQAVAYLEGNPALAKHADAHLQLGHAYATFGRHKDVVDSYQRALSRDKRLARDPDVANNLRLIVDGDDLALTAVAAELLLSELDDNTTKQRVVELASGHIKLAWRAKMREVAEHHGLSEKIDWRTGYTRDLAQAPSCEQRRAVVIRLRSLGDPKALGALEGAKKRADNGCLRDAATDAIILLSARTADDAK